jgi:putative resolvase
MSLIIKTMNDEYITSQKAKEILQVSIKTLYRWSDAGKIRFITTPSNRKRYNIKDVLNFKNSSPTPFSKKKICYCRVSSNKQMDDLGRQQDFFKSKYPDHELVTDVGSGINWKRKGLQTILEQSMSGHISEIVVAHRDRLCRFAFELLEWIFKTNNVKLVVLDEENECSKEKELADDILSIVHIYSCRQMGRRRYKNKKDKTISNTISKDDVEEMDGDEKICL